MLIPDSYYRYGYVTNTKIKFIIIVESSNTALRDNEIRNVSALFCVDTHFETALLCHLKYCLPSVT